MSAGAIRKEISVLKIIIFVITVLCVGFIMGEFDMVTIAASATDITYTYDPAGWEVSSTFNTTTGMMANNTTGGFTLIRQASGSTGSKSSSSKSSSSASSTVLKIPDYVTVTVSYPSVDANGKNVKATKTIRKPITELADNVFYQNDTLEEVVIPSTLKKVGNYAFYNCRNLKKIIIPSSVEELGEGAFEYCTSLQSVTIPSTLTEIKRHAFYQCTSLNDLKFMLPSTVKTIGPSAFSGCTSLSTITIPASVEDINEDAFENCSKLSNIIILTGEKNSVTVGKGAFEGCTGLKVFNVPVSVTSIGSHAFWNCTALNEVNFPDSYNQALLSGDVFEGCPKSLNLVSGKTSNVRLYAANHGIIFKYRTGALSRVVLDDTKLVWSGNVRRPNVVGVYDADGQPVAASDYSLSYADSKDVGYGMVMVTANGASCYTGSTSAYYTIVPRSTKFTKKKSSKKSIYLKWKKRSEGDGYQIQYSRYSDYRSSSTTTRSKNIKNKKTVTKTLTSLKKKKKYYIRIRSYKMVGDDKIYSDWSAPVVVKVK